MTSTVPAGECGDTAVIDVSPLMVSRAAGLVPNRTAVAPVNAAPAIVTLVPPDAGPELSEIDVTRGAATKPGARSKKALFDWL